MGVLFLECCVAKERLKLWGVMFGLTLEDMDISFFIILESPLDES